MKSLLFVNSSYYYIFSNNALVSRSFILAKLGRTSRKCDNCGKLCVYCSTTVFITRQFLLFGGWGWERYLSVRKIVKKYVVFQFSYTVLKRFACKVTQIRFILDLIAFLARRKQKVWTLNAFFHLCIDSAIQLVDNRVYYERVPENRVKYFYISSPAKTVPVLSTNPFPCYAIWYDFI